MWTERSNHQAPLQIRPHTRPASSVPFNDWILSVDAEATFWSVPIHPQSRKFMSSHYALPTFYESEGKATFVPLQPGGYWVLQHQVSRGSPRPPKFTVATHLACAKTTCRYRAHPCSHAIQVHGFASHLVSSFQSCCRSPSTGRPPRSGICRRPSDRPRLVHRGRVRQDNHRRDVRGLLPDTGTGQRPIRTKASDHQSPGVQDFLKGLGPYHSLRATVLSSAGYGQDASVSIRTRQAPSAVSRLSHRHTFDCAPSSTRKRSGSPHRP